MLGYILVSVNQQQVFERFNRDNTLKILTDNGVQCTDGKQGELALAHLFDYICSENELGHRTTPVKYPWTNWQIEVERMNRTIKQATVVIIIIAIKKWKKPSMIF